MQTGQFSSVSVISTFGVDIKTVDATTGEIDEQKLSRPVLGRAARYRELRTAEATGPGRGPTISRESPPRFSLKASSQFA